MTASSRARAVPAALALLMLLVGIGRPSALSPAQTPQFRSSVDLMAVDFFALSPDGRPVVDLKPEDITLRLDGKVRPVRSLELIEMAGAPAPNAQEVPPPYGTNGDSIEGRSIVIAIDHESFRPGRERPIRTAIESFLTSLSTRDRVALATVPHGELLVDLTTRHERVVEAMNKVAGLAPATSTASTAACRSRFTLEALGGLLDGLRGGTGPTTVMFFSAGMMGPTRGDVLRGIATSNACEVTVQDYETLAKSAARARAHLYVIHADDALAAGGVTGVSSAVNDARVTSTGISDASFGSSMMIGLEHMAGVTGGRQIALAVAGENPLLRVTRETAAYYLAAFELQPSDLTGQPHELDVKISRAGVQVQARPKAMMDRKETPTSTAPPGSTSEMIRAATIVRGLTVRAAGFSSRTPDGRLKIITVAEPAVSTQLESAAVGLFDANGRLVGEWNAKEGDLTTLPLMPILIVQPGTYRLRVAAIDAAGRAGTTDVDVVAELTSAGPLKLSGLALGLSRSVGFIPKLEFASEQVAIAYFEIYGGTAGVKLTTAMLELSQSLNGPPFMRTALRIEPTADADRFTVTGALAIGGLPPGDYVARAIVGVEGQAEGRIYRTLRKTGR